MVAKSGSRKSTRDLGAQGAAAKRTGRTSRKARAQQAAAELAEEISLLRGTLDEIVERVRVRIGGQLADTQALLEPGSEAKLPPAEALEELLQRVRKAELKPRKGRAKDLARLQELANVLSDGLGV